MLMNEARSTRGGIEYNKLRHGTKLAEFHAGVGQARFTGL